MMLQPCSGGATPKVFAAIGGATALGITALCLDPDWRRRLVFWLGRLIGKDPLTLTVGWGPQYPNNSISEEGLRHSQEFYPRVSDVFVVTPPKTGTTWMQMICHAVRTGGTHTDFDDIYQVVPWDQLAWDLGMHLDAEQVSYPRVFKTHMPLHTVSRGARYICVVRDVEPTLMSWYNFLCEKEVPPVMRYTSASDFVFDEDFVLGGMRFGASIWQYYVEFIACMELEHVLVLAYEDLVDDLAGHLAVVADFMGVPALDDAGRDRVLALCSRDAMAEASTRFDESWAYEQLKSVGRSPDNASSFKPAPRVRAAVAGGREGLSANARDMLTTKWREEVFARTGLESYTALRRRVQAEVLQRKVHADASAPSVLQAQLPG